MAQYGKFSTSIFEQFPASIKKYFSLEGRLGRLGTSEVTIPGTPKSRHIMARLIILSAKFIYIYIAISGHFSRSVYVSKC